MALRLAILAAAFAGIAAASAPGTIVRRADGSELFASYSATLVEAEIQGVLHYANTGCSADDFTARLASSAIAVVTRGGCSFFDKVTNAVDAGASAVIVARTEDSLYNFRGDALNPCDFDCGASCDTELPYPSKSSQRKCCVVDDLIQMGGLSDVDTVPAVFVSLATFTKLQDGELIALSERPTHAIDPSAFVLWLLAIAAVGGSSLYSSTHARSKRRGLLQRSDSGDSDSDAGVVSLEVGAVKYFALAATLFLLLIFTLLSFFPHLVVILLCGLFAMGSAGAIAQVTLDPLLKQRCRNSSTPSLIIASVFCGVWFFTRHDAYSWIQQDVMALHLCATFLRNTRLESLRVGYILLGSFFVYDVVMVFLTPLIFGKSVMMDVATAGGATASIKGETCERVQAERVPMLFAIPRVGWQHGYAMLGLGDVLLPGLLLSFVLSNHHVKHFLVAWLGYAIGLAMTFLANAFGWTVFGVQGQPALLYLVPCICIPAYAMLGFGDHDTDSWGVV